MDFLESEKDTFRDDGSTASTAVLVGNHLYVANVGDSRTIISKAGKGKLSLSAYLSFYTSKAFNHYSWRKDLDIKGVMFTMLVLFWICKHSQAHSWTFFFVLIMVFKITNAKARKKSD